MSINIYLSGEIHTDWRAQIKKGIADYGLDIEIFNPVTDHEQSDNVGVDILGPEDKSFWKDHKAAKINALRTQTYLTNADIVIVRFGEQYKQWNAAFDAGVASGNGIPIIVMHAPELTHALKEVDAAALAVTENVQQVVDILRYISQD